MCFFDIYYKGSFLKRCVSQQQAYEYVQRHAILSTRSAYRRGDTINMQGYCILRRARVQGMDNRDSSREEYTPQLVVC